MLEQPTLQLDLLQHVEALKVENQGNQRYIWDDVRGKFVVLQAEEFTRQLWVQYLWRSAEVPLGNLIVERKIDQVDDRHDLLIRDSTNANLLLLECKRFDEALHPEVLEQIMRYNERIQATYLMVSNGIQSYLWQRNQPDVPLIEMPLWKKLIKGNQP